MSTIFLKINWPQCRINEHTGQLLLGPNALWPTQTKFWVGHGPPGPRCSAPMLCANFLYIRQQKYTKLVGSRQSYCSDYRHSLFYGLPSMGAIMWPTASPLSVSLHEWDKLWENVNRLIHKTEWIYVIRFINTVQQLVFWWTKFDNIVGNWVSRVLRPARHITGHFRDESLQTITCTGTDKQEKIHQKHKINILALDQ